jgi:hypothetical protein
MPTTSARPSSGIGVMVVVGGGVKTSTGITRVFTGVLAEVGAAVGNSMVASRGIAPTGIAGVDCPQPVVKTINTKLQIIKVKILFDNNLKIINYSQSNPPGYYQVQLDLYYIPITHLWKYPNKKSRPRRSRFYSLSDSWVNLHCR